MNIAYLLKRASRDHPDKPAVIYGDESRTYAWLGDQAARMAGALLASGAQPGDRVVLALRNRPEYLVALFAALHAGMAAVPVNPHLHPKEIGYIAGDCAAAVVLHDAELGAVGAEAGALLARLIATPEPVPGAPCFADLVAHPPAPIAETRPDDPAWMFYTSGTTGRPKGAVLTHRNLTAMTMNFFADVSPVGEDAVFLHAAPLTHGSGLYALPAVAKAGTNVIASSAGFDPAGYAALIEQHRVTHAAFLAPTMLTRLLDSRALDKADLSSLRAVIVGGAPLYVSDLVAARDALGPILVQIYGQGEAPMTITATNPADLALQDPGSFRRLASCGRVRTDVEVRIVRDGGLEQPVGELGEVCVRGDVIMAGYWNMPEATAATLAGGWLHTGDIGYLDQGGYLFLVDRAKDVIITGGSNVYPREVEEALLTHPAVREAAVIGVPDRDWGESVKAVVSLRTGTSATPDELIAHCKTQIASYKKPRTVEIRAELPKSTTGKILKRELRTGTAQPGTA